MVTALFLGNITDKTDIGTTITPNYWFFKANAACRVNILYEGYFCLQYDRCNALLLEK